MKYYFEKYNVEILDNGNTVLVTIFELNNAIFDFDPMDAYADTEILDLVRKTYKNVLEVEDKIIRSENQQSALGAILSAKVGLNNIKSYEVVHDKNFMITDINISLNTRDQAIINNTHREVSQHFAANLYGIEINITKPAK